MTRFPKTYSEVTDHQEDDTGLGATWPTLTPSYPNMPSVPIMSYLAKKKDAAAKSAPRHPNSTDLANFRDLAKTAKTSNVTSK